jgi:hypothetical protein
MEDKQDDRPLAEREKEFCASLQPDALAKRLVPKLVEVAAEMEQLAATARTAASKELFKFDAAVLVLAAEALRRCEQEQWRQREAIKLFLHRRMTETDLRRISESWNGDGGVAERGVAEP